MERRTGDCKIDWKKEPKKHRGEELMKNIGVAASLVICAVTLKSGVLPQATNAADAVVTAVTDDTLLDDQLGKLSFVSALFPEATLVFGSSCEGELAMPVFQGSVVHAWSETEQYLAWHTEEASVHASADGTVMGVIHGPDEEILVQVASSDGMVCVYGNLQEASVRVGDAVKTGDPLGLLIDGKPCVFEVRIDGVSVDPVSYLSNAL